VTMDLAERKQFDQSAVEDDEAAARALVDATRADMHTSGPGIIQSFDADKQTAVVQPVVQKFFRGKGFKPLPKLMDVPVQFPRGGGFVLTFPVAKGDECLLVFSERAIDTWWESGGVQPPHEFRMHDLSDACAIVGISSKPSVVKSFNTGAVELRSLDGSSKLQIDNAGNVAIESTSGNVSVKSGGMIKLNASPAAVPATDGVLTASLMCPVLKAPHGTFGPIGISQKVVAG
jgi:hypothetical protein